MNTNLPIHSFDKTAVITTLSGVVGGVYKSVTLPQTQLLSITLDGSITVIIYAVFSAAAGYLTKLFIDFLGKKDGDDE